MIRVALIDDQSLVRSGFCAMLSGDEYLVVAEGETPEDAIRIVREHAIDVLILDIQLGDGPHGMNIARQLLSSRPAMQIIALSGGNYENYFHHLRDVGVKGFLTKDISPMLFFAAVNLVAEGIEYVDPALHYLLEVVDHGNPFQRLSRREMQVVEMLCQNLTPAEIARRLNISVRTIYQHKYNSLARLGLAVDDRVSLVQLAIRHGVITFHAEQ